VVTITSKPRIAAHQNTDGTLPAPSHAFARWAAGISVGFWAVGVQSLHDPWNKLAALLSPGLGYAVGQSLDLIIYRVSLHTAKSEDRKSIKENKMKIDELYIQRQDAITYGADRKLIESIDAMILQIQQTNVVIVAKSEAKTFKKTVSGRSGLG
jgi:hypothetical protein